MGITTIPGPAGEPPITVVISQDITSYAYKTLEAAVANLVSLYEEEHPGEPEPTIVVFTPGGLTVPSGTGHGGHPQVAAPDTIYIENFAPAEKGAYHLLNKASGIIITGTNDAEIYGRSGANELLVGNDGDDVIRGHAGTGTIIAGGGSDHIHSGRGNMLILAGTGNDTIHTASGDDTVMSFGNATVFAGSGDVSYTDMGSSALVYGGIGNSTLFAGSGTDHFTGGTGFTVMNSGTGEDTFTAGSGFSIENDVGTGHTDFDFNNTYHGSSIVTGFSSSDIITLEGYTVSQLLSDTTVMGGNSYVNLGDGTKIVFEGVDITKLSGQIH